MTKAKKSPEQQIAALKDQLEDQITDRNAEVGRLKLDLEWQLQETAKYRRLYEAEHEQLNGALLAMEVAVNNSATKTLNRFKAA